MHGYLSDNSFRGLKVYVVFGLLAVAGAAALHDGQSGLTELKYEYVTGSINRVTQKVRTHHGHCVLVLSQETGEMRLSGDYVNRRGMMLRHTSRKILAFEAGLSAAHS